MKRASGYEGPGQLVGSIDWLKLYELPDGDLVYWNARDQRVATNEDLEDPKVQSILGFITEAGDW